MNISAVKFAHICFIFCGLYRCCYRRCGSAGGSSFEDYPTTQENYCYKSSCPSGFETSDWPCKDMLCKRKEASPGSSLTLCGNSNTASASCSGTKWDRRQHDSICKDYEDNNDYVIRVKDG